METSQSQKKNRLITLAFACVLMLLVYGPLSRGFDVADRFLYDQFAGRMPTTALEGAYIVSIDAPRASVDEQLAQYGKIVEVREYMDTILADAALGFALCLLGIYLTLSWIFASWTRPLVVMSVIPFGLIGVIYGHWAWGGALGGPPGWLEAIGFIDFAGSTVVHSVGGWAALAGCIVLGPRIGKYSKDGKVHPIPGSNLALATLGTFILWLGWFGFNGGSQLAADGGAAMALTVTHISAATASLSWALWERIKYGKASMVGLVTGTIAGLASITPASGFVGPVEALIIGAVAGILCQEAVVMIRERLKIDDTLDVFAVHGVGGIFGTIMIAVFGQASLAAQLGSLAIVGIFTVVVTVIIFGRIRCTAPS